MTGGRLCGAAAAQTGRHTVGASARPGGRLLLLLVAGLGLLARPATAQTEVVEYYGHDALGSVRIVFTASGVATARADYEPFGEGVTIAGMPAGPLPAQQFTGQERDALERQDYFGARYYRPRHGRFAQVDPVYAGLFDPQQWNRYAYARNNPLSFVDPDGRDPTSCFDFAGAVRCVGETTRVTASLTRSIAQPRDQTAAAAEALVAMNNSCTSEGNSRACGFQRWEPKGPDGGKRASRLAEVIDKYVVDLDAMPPGDATVLELGLVVVEKNVEIIATGRLVTVVAKSLAGFGGDWIRFGSTRVPNQVVYGAGVKGSTRSTWGIKGGGPDMPYHFHIHDYNWYKPWEWFTKTDIVPEKWRYVTR